MDIGAHIPAYLFSEQFVSKARVLDVHPPDETGTALLAKIAGTVVLVQKTLANHAVTEATNTQRIVAAADALPFGRDSFDFVFFFARGEAATPAAIDDFLRCARSILSQSGLLGLVIPNRDAKSLDRKTEHPLLDFFGLERHLRRHFPHVNIFAQRPLHGATLSPLGRRETGAPLLDDRLLPDGGEIPSYFFALCAPRYHKVDDSIIAQLPSDLLVDSVRREMEELHGKMTVLRNENEMRTRDKEKLELRCKEAGDFAGENERLKHEKLQAENRAADRARQLELKKELELEYQQIQDELRTRLQEADQALHQQNRQIRNFERRVSEEEQKSGLALRERQDIGEEREKAVSSLRKIRAEFKTKQRELDDLREEMAGTEVELETLRKENSKYRREAHVFKEQIGRLEIELKELQDSYVDTTVLSSELSRAKAAASSERERLEKLLDKEHSQHIAAATALANTEQKLQELESERDRLQDKSIYADRRSEDLEQRLKEALSQRETLEQERLEAEQAGDDWARRAREHADELERHKHELDLLEKRATGAERRSSELEQQVKDLSAGLEETELSLSQNLDLQKTHGSQIESLKKENHDLATSLEQTTLRLAAREKAFTALQHRLESIRQEESAIETKAEHLASELKDQGLHNSSLLADNTRLTETLQKNKVRTRELEEQIQNEKQQGSKRATEYDSLTASNRELEAKLSGLALSESQLSVQIDALKEELQVATQAHNALQERGAGQEDENANLKIRLEDALKTSEELQTQLERASSSDSERKSELMRATSKAEQAEQRAKESEQRAHLADTRIEDLEEGLEKALGALSSMSEEVNESRQLQKTYKETIADHEHSQNETENKGKDLEKEMRRLLEEKETELLKVSDDLEKELRYAVSRYEASQGEIWELREELLRLKAQAAANAAVEKQSMKKTESKPKLELDPKLSTELKPPTQLYATNIPPLLEDFTEPEPTEPGPIMNDDDALFDELHAKLDALEDDTDF